VNLAELRTALQERREDYSQSDAKLDRKVNQSYLDICSRRRWGWLRREHSFATYAPHYETGGAGAVSVAGTENAKREITVAGAVPVTAFGKRVRIENDFYRVVNISSTGTSWTLDRPLRCTGSGTHYIKIIYDEVALPVGAISVVNCTLFRGGNTAYGTPLSVAAVSPSEMAYLEMDVEGRPTRFSTTRKEPIPAPASGPTLVGSGFTGSESNVYKYWYTHVDKQSGAESGLGPSTTITETSSTHLVIVGPVTARTDFNLRIYRSRVNEDTPRLLTDPQLTTATVTDNQPDEYLGPSGPNSAASLFLRMYPIPDDEYDVRSLIQIEGLPMGADNDRPLFDAEFHHIILDGAEALMLEAADEQGRAGSARGRFEVGIARMIQMDRTNMQNTVVFGGRKGVHGKPSWQYSSGTSEADFKA
jgi:hypothetical protein